MEPMERTPRPGELLAKGRQGRLWRAGHTTATDAINVSATATASLKSRVAAAAGRGSNDLEERRRVLRPARRGRRDRRARLNSLSSGTCRPRRCFAPLGRLRRLARREARFRRLGRCMCSGHLARIALEGDAAKALDSV